MDDITAIAAGLTEAQRRAVVEARFWQGSGAYNPPGHYVHADKRVRSRLCEHGILRDYLNPSQSLTPLGLRVRAHLEQHHAKD